MYIARSKQTQAVCAVKVLEKAHIMKFNKSQSVKREKEILFKFKHHPNIIYLECVFQDKLNLYFVFENCPNGTLANLIKINRKILVSDYIFIDHLSEHVTKIYAAELISVLECIHYNNVMHRDIKPENVLITKDFHLKVVSFSI